MSCLMLENEVAHFEHAVKAMERNTVRDDKLYIRQVAASICEVFEDLLDEHGIVIPDDDRTGADGEAALYGVTYAVTEDTITAMLQELIEVARRNPDKSVVLYEY